MSTRIVPWVVRRDNERPSETSGWSFVRGLDAFGNKVIALDSSVAERDEDGWLWIPGPDDPTGKPEWTQVHPDRQRRCMDECRCQVCGKHTRDPVWLPPAHELKTTSAGLTAVTYTPPVCDQCVPIARAQCPHLRRTGPTAYTPRRVLRWGVLGDLYKFPSGDRVGEVIVTRRDDDAPRVVARQRVVRLIDLIEVVL